ncbi:hypothetical protein CY35_15G043400 [Sphagnum magellanicum]|nr:hypothetical protein CY35_15G043400 [Sphagnum magellanicum]
MINVFIDCMHACNRALDFFLVAIKQIKSGKLLQILPGWSSHEDDERQTHRDTETEGWGFGLRALFLSQVEEMATTRSLWEMRRRMESSQSRVHGVWVCIEVEVHVHHA